MISLGSVTICILTSIMLVLYFCAILRQKSIFSGGIKLIFLGVVIVLLRLLVPINLPFRINIPIMWIMPNIKMFLLKTIFNRIKIENLILIIWGIGAGIIIFVKVFKYIRMRQVLGQVVNITEVEIKEQVFQFLSPRELDKVRIAVLHGRRDVIPFIMGLWSPILVLPDREFSEKELYYIVRHEIEHDRNYDLWLKLLLEFILSIYWWNPFVYILKKKFYLALEISNDIKTTCEMDMQEKISYAECLYHIAADYRGTAVEGGLSLFHEKKELNLRIHNVLNCNYNHKKKMCSIIINLCIVFAAGVSCLIFVPEPSKIPDSVQQETFSLNQDNSYLIETVDGYELYIDGNYMGKLKELPKTIELKIYKRNGEQ